MPDAGAPAGLGLFGQLAIETGFATADQIKECLRAQAHLGNKHQLGDLLVHRGYLKPEQLQKLLQLQKARQEQAKVPAGSLPASEPLTEPAFAPQPGPGMGGASRILVCLEQMEKRGVSDVHFHPGAPISVRLGGTLRQSNQPPLEDRELAGQLFALLNPQQEFELQEEKNLDVLVVTPNGLRCRGNFYFSNQGLNATFRLIRRTPPTLQDLALPSQLASFVSHTQGLVLVCGLAGTGKSSTLAALVDLIAQERADHILCLEDPIEIVHPAKKALVNQRQVGRDSASFARALRGALREDPDVIVIGELRDSETIGLAITAAETGHLVLASMQTASTARSISRILASFPPSQQSQVRSMVSESLHGVIAQRLVPAVDGGRAAAVEVLMVTPAVANLIREDKMFQLKGAIQTGKSQGMRSLDDSLRELVQAGRVSADEARRVAENPQQIPNGPGGVAAGATPTPAAGSQTLAPQTAQRR